MYTHIVRQEKGMEQNKKNGTAISKDINENIPEKETDNAEGVEGEKNDISEDNKESSTDNNSSIDNNLSVDNNLSIDKLQ